MVFKKAYSLYRQTAALFVVLIILTASVLYVIISPAGLPPESDNLVDISYPCPEDPRCKDTTGETASTQETEIQVANCEISDTEIAITPNEKEMFNQINNYRQQNGAPALSLSQGLSRAAAWLSHDMAQRDVLSHTDSLGRSPGPRVGDCGYGAYKAENIAMNTRTDPAATFEGWRNSSGHNANMLQEDARAIGVAEWRGNGFSYWTTDFGVRSDGDWDGGNPGPEPTSVPPNPTDRVPEFLISAKLPGIGPNINAGENNDPVKNTFDGTTTHPDGNLIIHDLVNNKDITNFGYLFDYDPATFTFKSGHANEGHTVQVPDGTYSLKVRFDNTLWKSLGIVEIVQNQTVTFPTVTLVPGDLNQDNELSLADYTILLSCYSNSPCDHKNELAGLGPDFNMDGKVDEKDLNIFYSGLAKRTGD